MKTTDSRRLGELAIIAGLAIVALAFFVLGNFTQSANPLDPGPALFPRMISTILLIMCVGQFAVTLRQQIAPSKKAAEAETAQEGNSVLKYVIGSLSLTAVYIFLFTKLTYVITTPLFMFGLLYLLGIRKWKILMLVPVGYTVISYFLYGTVLMVALP